MRWVLSTMMTHYSYYYYYYYYCSDHKYQIQSIITKYLVPTAHATHTWFETNRSQRNTLQYTSYRSRGIITSIILKSSSTCNTSIVRDAILAQVTHVVSDPEYRHMFSCQIQKELAVSRLTKRLRKQRSRTKMKVELWTMRMLQSKSTSALTMSERYTYASPERSPAPGWHFQFIFFIFSNDIREKIRDGTHVNMHRRIRNGYVLYQSRTLLDNQDLSTHIRMNTYVSRQFFSQREERKRIRFENRRYIAWSMSISAERVDLKCYEIRREMMIHTVERTEWTTSETLSLYNTLDR